MKRWFALLLRFLIVCLPCMVVSAQHAVDLSRVAAQSATPGSTLIKNVSVLTIAHDQSMTFKEQSVLVVGKKIARIADPNEIPLSATATIIDGRGKFLVPGLIDAHVHVWDETDLLAYLAYGVTTVRNASGMPFHLSFARDIEAGRLEGPHLLTTGPILNGRGPNTQINHQIVNNASEARAAVQQQYQQGYRHLKVYSNLSRESYEAILSESRRLGMTVMGHTPEGVREPDMPRQKPFNIAFTELLDDGFVSIEHMESIVWHGLSDQLDEDKVRQLARTVAKTASVITPTLVAHHNLVRVATDKQHFLQRDGTQLLNPYIVALEKDSYSFWLNQEKNARRNFDQFYARASKIFYEEGVKLITGTDAGIFTNIPGISLHDELDLLLSAGLSPAQAIAAATITAAEALGLHDEMGQIKTGYRADLLLLDKDPTQFIETLRSPVALMVAGRWYDKHEIARLKRDAVSPASYARTKQRIEQGLKAQGSN